MLPVVAKRSTTHNFIRGPKNTTTVSSTWRRPCTDPPNQSSPHTAVAARGWKREYTERGRKVSTIAFSSDITSYSKHPLFVHLIVDILTLNFDRYKSALRSFYARYNTSPIFFEIAKRMLHAVHAQVHVLPIPNSIGPDEVCLVITLILLLSFSDFC